MLIALWGPRPEISRDVRQNPQPKPQVRRGVTALEYLVCISLILAVVILTVQHLGSLVGGMFANSAKATTPITGP